jgi:hypothetical protein
MKCPACGLMQIPGPACKSCGSPLGGSAVPLPGLPQKVKVSTPDQQYEKIGGWLILVAIGLVLTPLRSLVIVGRIYLPMFMTERWAALTTPGGPAYHPLWAPILIFEFVGNIAVMLFGVVAAVCLFQKRRIFPKLMIAFLLSNLLFVGADYVVADWIPAVARQNDRESLRELGRTLFACLIWIPYFLVSKRVTGTFLH